jgi:hydroxymethylglutaryl-CoA lyase
MAQHVRITEVGPRDGLQNEPGVIPTANKVRLVELCAATGVDEVEVTSFVSPKWVPQLGDSAEVWRQVAALDHATHKPMFSALVPNERGMDTAVELEPSGMVLEKVSVFTAASETFNKRNTNATIAESIERFRPVVQRAHGSGGNTRLVRGYISCAIACPFEGPIAPTAVTSVARQLIDIGIDEIDIGDTIGAGTPDTVGALLKHLRSELGIEWWQPNRFTLHLHDTFSRAAECVKVALDLGVRSFDSSVAGLGGCPYASTSGKRAPGNISTETLVRTIKCAGYTTGVNLGRLQVASEFALQIVSAARAQASASASESLETH